MRHDLLLLCLIFANFLATVPIYMRQETTTSLEIRFAEPLRWENGCLATTLERVNHSAHPLFLTKMGPYFDIALDVSRDIPKPAENLEWVNIFGVVDAVDSRSDVLAPGSTMRNRFCFEPIVWLTNIQQRTRRSVQIRGKMRIRVAYFLNKNDAERYDKHGEEGPLGRTPVFATFFADIPCEKSSCDCDKPPIGIHREVRLVPDVGQFIPEVNAHGKELADELSRKFPPCSEHNKN